MNNRNDQIVNGNEKKTVEENSENATQKRKCCNKKIVMVTSILLVIFVILIVTYFVYGSMTHNDEDDDSIKFEDMTEAAPTLTVDVLVSKENSRKLNPSVPASPLLFANKMAGNWSMYESKNGYNYYKSLGVNTLMAKLAASINAVIEIIPFQGGFEQLTRTAIQNAKQIFSFENPTVNYNPLMGANETIVAKMRSSEWQFKYHHDDDLTETVRYTLKEKDSILQIKRKTNKGTVIGRWMFKRLVLNNE